MRPWLIDLPTCPSTSTWAMDHREALAHGAVVHTARQTAGRGRAGRRWEAPPGVLTASVVLRPGGEVAVGQVALAAGLAVVHACDDLRPGLGLGLKWPNDVQRGGRKLAGILCERSGDGVLVVGIGLNRDPRWEGDPPTAVASLAEDGPAPEVLPLLTALRRYLLEACGLIAAGGWPRLLPGLRRLDRLAGRAVVVEDGPRRLAGTALGIADDGGLRLALDAGGEAVVASGHVAVAG